MTRLTALRALVILAILAGGLPAMPGPAEAAVPAPCHEMMPGNMTDMDSAAVVDDMTDDMTGAMPPSHAACDQCTMGCCLAQIPAAPVFDAVGHAIPVFIAQVLAPEGFSSAPPTAPPRG